MYVGWGIYVEFKHNLQDLVISMFHVGPGIKLSSLCLTASTFICSDILLVLHSTFKTTYYLQIMPHNLGLASGNFRNRLFPEHCP